VISERRQHCDEPIASVCKGENAKCVERAWSAGDGWKQPTNILFIDNLWEEGNDAEKPSSIGPKVPEHRRGEGEFDRGREASRVLCVKDSRPLFLPFLGQSAGIPLIVLANSCE